MNNIKVAVTGFYGTGSSAVLDLLKEYRNAHAVPEIGRPYEHTTFYVSGGLYDLCTLLSHGNAPLQSDYVINNFISKMRQLNDYNYLWFGSFKTMTGNKFMKAVERLVNTISQKTDSTNYNHVIKTRFSPYKAILQLAARIIYHKRFSKYGVGYVYDKNPVYYSNPTIDELFAAAKTFTNDYFDLFASQDSELDIYDHLIWPQQVDSHSECFDDNFKVIVVDRDPRDVYISDQFLWSKPPLGRGLPHFSEDPDTFITEWKRSITRSYKNPNVLQIHFEDLVYEYEKTVHQIEEFLGLTSNMHIHPKKFFIPERSIENTQVFLCNPKWKDISAILKDELSDFIYDFPNERTPNKNNLFA